MLYASPHRSRLSLAWLGCNRRLLRSHALSYHMMKVCICLRRNKASFRCERHVYPQHIRIGSITRGFWAGQFSRTASRRRRRGRQTPRTAGGAGKSRHPLQNVATIKKYQFSPTTGKLCAHTSKCFFIFIIIIDIFADCSNSVPSTWHWGFVVSLTKNKPKKG